MSRTRPDTAPAEPQVAEARSAADRPTTQVAPTGPRRTGRALGIASAAMYRFGLLIVWAFVVATFAILRPTEYFTVQNFETMFSSQAVLLVLAIASLAPLIAGELDLSVAAVFGLVLVVVGQLNGSEGWPIGLAIAAGLLVGIAVGVFNSIVVVMIGVDSIVATLGMATFLGGVMLGISPVPAAISLELPDIVRYRFAGLQVSFYFALAVCIVMWFVFEHTPVGRRLYFVGAGRDVARLSGIRVGLIRTGALVGASTLSAIAGVMMAGLLGASDPTIGPTFLLPALAAVFLGATTITPGRFNVWGTFIAVYFLVSGITGLELMGFAGWISQAFYGGALIVAVVLSRLAGRRSREFSGA